MSYTVIGTRKTRAFRVLWMLEELGVEYEHIPALPLSDEVRMRNLSGKVPVLLDGDTVIPDSTAILTYLADKHGKFTHPAGTPERAAQDSMTQLVLDEFDALIWTAARHSFVLPKEQRVPDIKDTLRWEWLRHLTHFAVRLEEPYLTGGNFLICDIIAVHCLAWAKRANFDLVDPRVTNYLQLIEGRTAYQRVLEME